MPLNRVETDVAKKVEFNEIKAESDSIPDDRDKVDKEWTPQARCEGFIRGRVLA